MSVISDPDNCRRYKLRLGFRLPGISEYLPSFFISFVHIRDIIRYRSMLKGFKDFILKGNVIDLAVAVVIGGAFGTLVTALVKDLITPLVGAIGGDPDFSQIYFTINGSKFMIGDFLNALISFLIISAVVYFLIVLPMNKLMATFKKGQAPVSTEKTCPECLSFVPIQAKRCKFCTVVFKM